MPAAEIGLGLDFYHFIGDPQPEALVGAHGEALGVAAVAFDYGNTGCVVFKRRTQN